MHLSIPGTLTLNASADAVWQVIGHDFVNIGTWASAIPISSKNAEVEPIGDAPVGGRVCETAVAGFPAISETITYFNEEERRLKYTATEGLAFFVKAAKNDWQVKPLGEDRSEVIINGSVELNSFWGILFYPLLKWQMGRVGKITLADLRHYIERGKPHPRNSIQ